LAIRIVGLPGAQGAGVKGMQGIGVRTPRAAAVAAATVGFAIELHIPNGAMFAIGLLSIIFASGMDVTVLLTGRTFRTDGASPNVHRKSAPPQTAKLMGFPPNLVLIHGLRAKPTFCLRRS
jgi:hypothetical protein